MKQENAGLAPAFFIGGHMHGYPGIGRIDSFDAAMGCRGSWEAWFPLPLWESKPRLAAEVPARGEGEICGSAHLSIQPNEASQSSSEPSLTPSNSGVEK